MIRLVKVVGFKDLDLSLCLQLSNALCFSINAFREEGPFRLVMSLSGR